MPGVLTNRAIADEFMRQRGAGHDRSANALVSRIGSFLAERRIAHRDALSVAEIVLELNAARAAQESSPSHEGFQANVREGTTRDDAALQYESELVLARQVQAMDMATYARNRPRLGMGKTTLDHLAGL